MDSSNSSSASASSNGCHTRRSSSFDSDSNQSSELDLTNKPQIQSSEDQQHGNIIISNSGEFDPSRMKASLSKLCNMLSDYREGSISATTLRSLPPKLVKLVKLNTNPDITLLAIRAITFLCALIPESSGPFVSHDVVPALCQRLQAIDYQEVADQCIEALDIISEDDPDACLQAGATMAILNSIDFLSPSIQIAAISTVQKIYFHMTDLESPFPSVLCMEAVPILCNLLQYEEPQIVKGAACCLIMTTGKSKSPEMLDQLCKHGFIEQAVHLLSLANQTETYLSPSTSTEFIILLGYLSLGSVVAFRTLHDLNISSILKNILSLLDLSKGMSSLPLVGRSYNQGYEILKLLNELLPIVTVNQNDPLILDKESFLADRPYLLQTLEMDMLPLLIKVVCSDGSAHIDHGCLSVIYKIVYSSKSDMFVESLKKSSISSCLAGVFIKRRDYHELILALQITELILHKFSDHFLKLFIKEGVSFAIKALSSPEASLQLLKFNRNLYSSVKCPCYGFSYGQSSASSNIRRCKLLNKDSMYNLLEYIKAKYLEPGHDFKKGATDDILQNLRYLSAELSRLLSISVDNDITCSQIEDGINSILYEMLEILSGKEQVSVFEFMESGIVDSLGNYLSHGEHVRKNGRLVKYAGGYDAVIEKQVEALAKVSLSVSNSKHLSGDTPLSLLIRNLQNALNILRTFPLILSGRHGPISSLVDVPYRRYVPYYCLKVWFIKGEGEASLDDFTEKPFVTADPFSTLHTIEGYLWPKVRVKNTKRKRSSTIQVGTSLQGNAKQEQQLNAAGSKLERQYHASRGDKAAQNLVFYLGGQQLDPELSLYQAILCQKLKWNEAFSVGQLWMEKHTLTFRRASKSKVIIPPEGVSDMEKSSPANTILLLLKRIHAFSVKEVNTLSNLKSLVPSVAQNEFVNKKLTEKLEQQMGDSLAMCIGGMPVWCTQLMVSYHFLFSYETRCKFFKLAAYAQPHTQRYMSYTNSGTMSDWRLSLNGLPRKKFVVFRTRILESAAQMMNQHASRKVALEVEYDGELGTGRGPTLEFYTLVCKEFQKPGLGMWREDTYSQYGLFPRPWLSMEDTSIGNEVQKKFVLLGQVVAKAIEDGWHLDFNFSKAFYKLILGKELSLYDIQSFDPGLGRVLLKFHELVKRKRNLGPECREDSVLENDLSFEGTKIEDLCLDFSLPGYPQTFLASGPNHEMVNMSNLEDYVSLITDETVGSGISHQVEAFKQGFNQVFSIGHLRVFSEAELELILCGEQDSWTFNELTEHIKFDQGYTARSPSIVDLLEILQEFDQEQRRGFLQFVTGSPRLPPGGLASLNPKLTVVRKLSYNHADEDLPSVMTCANYLKLPMYSSKETLKEKLLYAITEGHGSFHLS